MITYRELLERIAEKYGLYARPSWDGDMDIIMPYDEKYSELRKELEKFGFIIKSKVSSDRLFREWHIHSPHRQGLLGPRGWENTLEYNKPRVIGG